MTKKIKAAKKNIKLFYIIVQKKGKKQMKLHFKMRVLI